MSNSSVAEAMAVSQRMIEDLGDECRYKNMFSMAYLHVFRHR